MTSKPPKKTIPTAPVPEPQAETQRTGSGSDTALQAMLRKRRMRAGAEHAPPAEPVRKPPKA